MPEMKGGRFFLLLLNMNQAVVDVLGEDDIVEAQPDIVAEDAFFRRRSSRCFSGQNRSYFPKLTEALKMPEIFNMVTIIGKYLVKNKSQFWNPFVCTGITVMPGLKQLSSARMPSALVMQEMTASVPSMRLLMFSLLQNGCCCGIGILQ